MPEKGGQFSMHTSDNKAVARRFFEDVINGSDLDRAGEFVTADYIEHQHLPGAGGAQGIEIAKRFLSIMRTGFPDFRFEIEDLIAEGNKVAARVSVSGTHRGELMGIAPTGKRVTACGIEIFRFRDSKMAEHWATFDALGMLQQIGVVPVPNPGLFVRTLIHQVKRRLPDRRREAPLSRQAVRRVPSSRDRLARDPRRRVAA
jgi:predicted ester cyclase